MRAKEIKKRTEQLLRIMVCHVLVVGGFSVMADTVRGQECPDPAPQTTGTLNFRRLGETFEIPIALDTCQAISLTVRWSNGRNHGSLINLTFFDSDDRPLYTKQISAFLTGVIEFPLMPVGQGYGMVAVNSVPALVTAESAYPFGAPAFLHYTITRANRRPRGRLRGINSKLATSLQSAPGNVLFSASSYSLTELPLPEARELEVPGRRKTVRNAFRLMLSPATVTAAQNAIDLIWIDDIAVPTFRSGTDVGALIFDDAVLRNGAEISVSNLAANRFQSLSERLSYQTKSANARAELAMTEQGNVLVGIKNVARVIGGRRQPLVQMQLRTERPFPTREKALRLQVGKSLFLDELSGDHTGRTLTLTVTPEMFAEMKDGASILAFYEKPDGSSFSGMDVWYFGKLDKSAIE